MALFPYSYEELEQDFFFFYSFLFQWVLITACILGYIYREYNYGAYVCERKGPAWTIQSYYTYNFTQCTVTEKNNFFWAKDSTVIVHNVILWSCLQYDITLFEEAKFEKLQFNIDVPLTYWFTLHIQSELNTKQFLETYDSRMRQWSTFLPLFVHISYFAALCSELHTNSAMKAHMLFFTCYCTQSFL